MKTKRCSKCKRVLPLSEFHKDGLRKDGLAYPCKQCRRNYYTVSGFAGHSNLPAANQKLLDEALDSCLERLCEIEENMLELKSQQVAVKTVLVDLEKANRLSSMKTYKVLKHGSFRYCNGKLQVR